jgi:hypothetical protein
MNVALQQPGPGRDGIFFRNTAVEKGNIPPTRYRTFYAGRADETRASYKKCSHGKYLLISDSLTYLAPVLVKSILPCPKDRYAIKSTCPVIAGAGRQDECHPWEKMFFNFSGKLLLIPPGDNDDQRDNPRNNSQTDADHSKDRGNSPSRPLAHEARCVVDTGRDDIEDSGNAAT